MKAKQGRLDRVARLVPYYLAAGLAGALAVYAEYRARGTVLLVPAFHWTSRPIPGRVLVSPAGDYSLSFKHTRLDWRLVSRGGKPGHPALTAGTAAGWRLRVWESPAGAGAAPSGTDLGGGLRLGSDAVVRGRFAAGAKDLTLEFSPPPFVWAPDETTAADLAEIARSLKPAELKAD